MRELISLQEPQETKIILFFFCWQTKVYRTCGKQQKCKHLDFCNDLDKNLWKSLDKQPHLSRGLNSGPELQMQPETAAQQNPSASHQNGSSLREGQFLPVLFTATSQCLELWQDNIRVFTIWANSLPLCSRLDLASVFFFYFGCETVPLLPAPCRSLGESRLLQLQRLQVLQENHWGSQQERPAALPGAPGRSWQHSSSGLWQEIRVGELALLPRMPGSPYLSSSLSFFWLFSLLFHLLSLLFVWTQKGKINILCFSCHQYQIIWMHTSICHSLQTPRNTHKEDICFSSEGRIQYLHNSETPKHLVIFSQGNYIHVFDS